MRKAIQLLKLQIRECTTLLAASIDNAASHCKAEVTVQQKQKALKEMTGQEQQRGEVKTQTSRPRPETTDQAKR